MSQIASFTCLKLSDVPFLGFWSKPQVAEARTQIGDFNQMSNTSQRDVPLCRLTTGCVAIDPHGLTWRVSWPLASVTVLPTRIEVQALGQKQVIELDSLISLKMTKSMWPFPAASLNFIYRCSPQPRIEKLFLWKSQCPTLSGVLIKAGWPLLDG